MGLLPYYDESMNLPLWNEYICDKVPQDLILGIGVEADLITIVGQHCVAHIESKSNRYFALVEILNKLNDDQALVLIREAQNEVLFNVTFDPSIQGEWESDDNPKVFYPIGFSRDYVDNLIETVI